MAGQFEHLELPMVGGPLPRRSHGGGKAVERNRPQHGRKLLRQAVEVSNKLRERIQRAPKGINPKLVFKILLNPKGNLTDDQIRQMGFSVLARERNKAIVVFPDKPSLEDFQRRLRTYSGIQKGPKYDYLASIEGIAELTAQDRIGPRLLAKPLDTREATPLDVELWHPGNKQECQAKVGEIRGLLQERNLRVTDWYVGESLCLLRAYLDQATLNDLLQLDYVKEIDRRPEPVFEFLDVLKLDLSQITPPNRDEVTLRNLIGVLVIDSGVMQGHPLLGPVLGDAQVFPDQLRERIRGGSEDGDEAMGGHGTAVAGIAVYTDVGECIERRVFTPSASLFSARVTDDQNEYDLDELLEHQLQKALEYFFTHYPTLKVVNISLGDSRLVYSDNSYQFRLAAMIDEMAYQHRDREVVFVVSAGNFVPERDAEDVLKQYPGYLLEDKDARVIDPATSALAVTVGGLSYGAGAHWHQRIAEGTERLVAGERGWPSPFTRTGWGVDGSVKPDVVDYAGDLRFERGRITDPTRPAHSGLPTTAKNFAPPDGALFRTVAGTSFSAPKVANLAAQLFRDFPAASSNLIRALIADSARLPISKPARLAGMKPWDDEMLRIYGYGQPDFQRARWSAENRVLLLADTNIEVDSFQLYTIPPLPSEFFRSQGKGYLSVALAFDPPTRHTRGDSYLGVTIEFALFRNVSADKVAEALRVWDRREREDLEDGNLPSLASVRLGSEMPIKVGLKPGVNRRKKGTLQRGIVSIAKSDWGYDGGPLVLAIVCQRKWAPVEINRQRYAVVSSVWHENERVNLYARLRQRARVYQRARVRL